MRTENSLKQPSQQVFVISAFVLGVLVTAFVMSRGRSAPPVAATSSKQSAQVPEEAGGAQRLIKLNRGATVAGGIRVKQVRLTSVRENLIVPGTVEPSPNRIANITSPSPAKVMRILVDRGEYVHAGQALVELDSFEVAQSQASVRLAESAVQQAQATLQTARAETAHAHGVERIAGAELEQARTKENSAESALARQKELAAAGVYSQAPLQSAQSDLADAQSALLKSQSDMQARSAVLTRAERLFKYELVSRGELEQAQAESRRGQAELDRAQARVLIARQALDREQRVFSADLLSRQAIQPAEAEVRQAHSDVSKAVQGVALARQDVLRAETGVRAATIGLQGAKAGLSGARANLYALTGTGQLAGSGKLTLYAPMGGTITERALSPGQAVERATTLLVIENLTAVTVNAQVAENDVARVGAGQAVLVTVAAYPDERFPGVVQSVSADVDEKTRTLAARCLVENRAARLKPDMFASVSIAIRGRVNVLAVPTSAIDQDGADRYVFVEKNGGYERRKIQPGITSLGILEVVSGLKVGDRVVVDGVFSLKSESRKSELQGGD